MSHFIQCFSQSEKFNVDQAFSHYFLYADFKTIKIFNFDAFIPFVLAISIFNYMRHIALQFTFSLFTIDDLGL